MPRGVSIYDEARLQGRLWTPALERPAFWLDVADISTMTIATGVSHWRDKSGNGANATQAAAARQPAYSPVAFSGLPGITTDGVDDGLEIVTPLAQGNLNHAVYWVMRVIGAGSGIPYRPLISVRTSVAQDVGALIYRNPSGLAASYPYYGQPTNGFFDNGPPVAANNTSNIFSFQANGTGWGSWQNGILLGTTTPAAGAPTAVNTGFILGYQPPPSSRFTNAVYTEVVGFSFATPLLRLRMEGYFAWRWDLLDRLLASHPFRNRPPLIGD